MTAQSESQTRCHWCTSDEIYIRYHDEEWGVPCHDDQTLFEFLILEGAQAGLNWPDHSEKAGRLQKGIRQL